MIYGLAGRPRSGKSYEAVRYHIIPAVQEGRKVITNIPLNIDKFRAVFGDDKADLIEVVEGQFDQFGSRERPFSKVQHYQCEWRNENNLGPLYVIDEAHLSLPRQVPTEVTEFYSMHGHYGIDIILLTQNLRKINIDIRDMIEMTYNTVKNTHLGTDKTYTKRNFIGATLKNPVSNEERKYDKNYFGFYKSHTASKSAVTEAEAQDNKSVYDTWTYKFGRVLVVIGILATFYAFYSLFFGSKSEPEVELAKTEQVHQATQSNRQTQQGFGMLESFQFYVAGWSKQISSHRGKLDPDLSFFRVYVDVYLGESYQFTLEHTDLIELGYEFKQMSECVFKLNYFQNSRLVTCKHREEQPEIEASLPVPDVI
ncbi:MAG: assembly protein [Vibrio sp.]|uniref:zonular occludens toxin domain-containing protein n=1 Tax=Vibrio TaxID=662 RepID=UPI001ECEC5D7|nr:zonular occludens toxin domain-containing protein [Vibrio sp.]NRB69762.1 assembly protein [Vibrio sp.]